MKERSSMEKFAVFPFSLGCASDSSVAVANPTTTGSSQVIRTKRQDEELESPSNINIVKTKGFWSRGGGVIVHTLKMSFKVFSQLFVYKEEEEEEEIMEIGLPTDVKHVTHIGWDGSTKVNPIKDWDINSKAPHELLSFPNSIDIKQFELVMAAQATGSSREVQRHL